MKLGDIVRKAVETRDPILAGKVADVLRFRFGMNYNQIYEYVNRIAPIPTTEWETLMYEADT